MSGNAVKNVVAIDPENIKPTLQDIYEKLFRKLNLFVSDVAILGSAGKKNSPSGDLDIGLPIDKLIERNNLTTIEDILYFISDKIKEFVPDMKIMKGVNMISAAWKIYNMNKKQENKFVQVDLMLVDDIKWASFAAFSPYYYESKWKGVYRTLLIMAVAKEVNYKSLKKVKEIDIEWERYIFDKSTGLQKVVQTNIGKTGKIIKTNKVLNRIIVTQDPQTAINLLFGSMFTINDLNSFETVLKTIYNNNFIYKNKTNKILKSAAQSIYNNKLQMPEELKNYL